MNAYYAIDYEHDKQWEKEIRMETCAECGTEADPIHMVRCYICESVICKECHDAHVEQCENDNGQFGVGA